MTPRVEILDTKMGPMLKDDFQALFEQAGNLPVTIRLLDPPLHEFLPTDLELKDENFAADLAKKCSWNSWTLERRAKPKGKRTR